MDKISTPYGSAYALELLESLKRKSNDLHDKAYQFARIIIGLFPDWFDFHPDRFTIHPEDRGLRLIVQGKEGTAQIRLSDSRNIWCITVYATTPNQQERGLMSMHYIPSSEQLEQAQKSLFTALRNLFPDDARLVT